MDRDRGTSQNYAVAGEVAASSQANGSLVCPNGKEQELPRSTHILGGQCLYVSLAFNVVLTAIVLAVFSPATLSAKLQTQLLGRWDKEVNKIEFCNTSENKILCLPPDTPRLSYSADDHLQKCSGNGFYVVADRQQQIMSEPGACYCHPCFAGPECADLDRNCILNIFHGDPVMFEAYWLAQPQAPTVIPAWQGLSYFSHRYNSFLFVDYHLEQEIRKLHDMVGNAITAGRYIVLGVGSTQVFQAALYALASEDSPTPTSIISGIPYYSSYEGMTKVMNSKNVKWVGDASKFQQTEAEEPYIELVTSPNNPCGSMNKAVVNGTGPVLNDLAYYWPHYTPITAPADYPVMLWTLSKITGHAGSRIGWAIVKDKSVADKMGYFIRDNTLGLSQDAQARATSLLRTIISTYRNPKSKQQRKFGAGNEVARQPFFHYGQAEMEDRWKRMRGALESSSRFSTLSYEPAFCTFLGKHFKPNPAFMWLKCKEDVDCTLLMKEHGMITRGGHVFGVSAQFTRVPMLDREPLFNLLVSRIASM